MKKSGKLAILSGAALFCFSVQNSESATLITGVTVSNMSRENTASGSLAVNSIDGSGLNTSTGQHDTGVGNEWLAGNGTNSGDFIEYDLGSGYILDSIHMWNANSNTGRGIQDVDIYFSNVASPGDPEGSAPEQLNWTRLGGATVTLPQSPATSTYTGFDLESATITVLPTSAIRYVRFELNTTYGNAYAGISEIQFFEAVPEPSAALLGCLGALLLLRRRR
jgi:hypothetical protein